MRATLAVAAREIAERKVLFLGALVLGILPLFFPLIPGLRGNSRDARTVAVLLVTAAIAVGFPLALGATILVSDIAQKRLAFYFSRPLPSGSIWAGKLLGALLISAGCALLTMAPVFLVESAGAFSSDAGGLNWRVFLALALPGVLVLFLAAHAAASMARLRSRWIVIDFFLTVFFAVLFWFLLRSLVVAGFWDISAMTHPPDWVAWWLFLPLAAVLLVASYVQIASGRTDAARSHGALSATLWVVLTLLALPLGGLAWWVNAVTPKDLTSIEEIQLAPRGSWVRVRGGLRLRGSAKASFFYDTETGRSMKRRTQKLDTSADGKRAAYTGVSERKWTIHVMALDSTEAPAIDTHVEMGPLAQLALSPSGRRLATADGATVAAYDVADSVNPKHIALFRLPGDVGGIVFVDEDTIRLFPRFENGPGHGKNAEPSRIANLSLSSKKLLMTGALDRSLFSLVRLSADGRFLVASRGKRLTLHDGRTGVLLATLSEDLESPKLRFLSGDRLVVAGVANGKAVLKIFLEGEMTESAPPRLVDMGPATSLILGGEVAAGRVAVALNPFRRNDERAQRAWKLAFVDVATGAVSSGPDGLVPADQFSWWFSPTLPPAESGSPASGLFLDASSRLVRLDPATGAQTVLLGRSK
ncbi:MAG: hypothetical protein PT977_00400 [Acidobacteriota bacterium]|nr:hypothetical protein [Acidobacteriota bacterium]